MLRRLRKINEVLPDMIFIMLAYGIVAEVVGVWFAGDRIKYSIGLAIGVVLAIFMAIHMAIVIEDSLNVQNKRGQFRISLKGIARYAVVAVVVFATVYFELGSVVAIFVGLFSLKISAYLQPVVRKRVSSRTVRDENL